MEPSSAVISDSQLRGVIFDVDGTLVDSERNGHRVAFNDTFAEFDLPHEWSVEEYGELLRTTGGRQRIEGYLLQHGYSPSDAADWAVRLHKRKTERFTELVRAGVIPLRDGVAAVIGDLQQHAVPLHVATTGTRMWVEAVLAQHFPSGTFGVVVTGDDVETLKPAPDAYLEVLRRLGTGPTGFVAVEDSLNGLNAAHGAGLTCLMAPNDYTRGDISAAELVVDGFGGVSTATLQGLVAPTGSG
jgi:HAD superfamily hydrolase (TIGR01509 family)